MRDKLTWLHISDIHFNPKTEWRDSSSRSTLLTHLTSIFANDSLLRPDFVFCTGDIAFGETFSSPLSAQYEQAKIFFDGLLLACGQANVPLSKGRLFVVPGNHDVNRDSINTDAQVTLTTWASEADKHVETIDQRFNDRNKEFKDAIKRLDAYAQFVKDYLPHQHDANDRHCYAHISDFDGLKVGIAGFNSAWTCSGSEDDRNIWLAANWQFNSAQQVLKDANIRIGLMHHPVDWLNAADRDIATRRIASNYDFWLHGHSHKAWIMPIQSHIVIAAGAVGAKTSAEFGINIACIDLADLKGVAHLYNKKAESDGWTIAPVAHHAPTGQWAFDLPTRLLRGGSTAVSPLTVKQIDVQSPGRDQISHHNLVDSYHTKKLDDALQSFSSQPRVWVRPILSRRAEIAHDAKSDPKIDPFDLIANPKSTIIKAPPQYGLTCLAHFLAQEAWRSPETSLWLYLDSKSLKPHTASIDKAIVDELENIKCLEQDIKCLILDSWSVQEKDAFKLLKKLCERFKDVPIICMQQADSHLFNEMDKGELGRQFDGLYLWSLSRGHIRKIVADYNDSTQVGDEDAVTTKLVSDLDVLNLHRTPLNCLTLLKASEVDFDESPVNRSEMIKRVLFLLFNVDAIPTYKSRPDLKDCEYVLGYFCELLIMEGMYSFTRDRFLLEIQKCCQETLIDLETHVVFDVLHTNNILIKRGSFFHFKFAYWIFYFAAQRMHHNQNFANYIFDQMRYAQYPELIEFYTGIDRRREDALQILIRDIQASSESIKNKCGLPDGLNPYRFAKWTPSPETQARMQQEIANGVLESNLPAEIKDQYADQTYDQARPYDQHISSILTEHSFTCMMRTMRAGARALRNSDYVSPQVKRELLRAILNSWEQASKVLLIVVPILAEKRHAIFDETGFVLCGDCGDTPEQRMISILNGIPSIVVSWGQDDLFSKKMGPLLFDQLGSKEMSAISRHELILLLIQQRPRDWSKHIQRYIASTAKNSFYLYDVYIHLRAQYRYSFATPHTLRDIGFLIKMAATKHITGDKEPGVKSISKVKFIDDPIPPREV